MITASAWQEPLAREASARACILCGSTAPASVRFAVDHLSRERFRIVECVCGLSCVDPRPHDLRGYYPQRHQESRPAAYELADARPRAEFVARLRGGIPGTVLDVGCGKGLLLSRLRDRGWRVFGTEMSRSSSRYARDVLALRVLDEAIEDCVELPAESFDVVTLFHSLEHMSDPKAVICQARRLLRPDGLLVVEVPNYGCWQARLFGSAWFHLDVPRHLFHFRRSSLEALLEQAGFRLRTVSRRNIMYDSFGTVQSALNTVLRRKNLLNDFATGQIRIRDLWRSPPRWRELVGLAVSELALVAGMPLMALVGYLSALCGRGGVLRVVAQREVEPDPDLLQPAHPTRGHRRQCKS